MVHNTLKSRLNVINRVQQKMCALNSMSVNVVAQDAQLKLRTHQMEEKENNMIKN